MRLPALATAALYLAAVYRICVREFQSAFASLCGAALLTLNPLLLDFMVAARGYGLGLALLMWAFAVLLDYVRQPGAQTRARLWTGGAALGLSVAANLIFAVPAAVLVCVAWALSLHMARVQTAETPAKSDRKKKVKKAAGQSGLEGRLWRDFVLPASGVAILFFLVAPLDKANTANFYVGAQTIVESLRNLAGVHERDSFRPRHHRVLPCSTGSGGRSHSRAEAAESPASAHVRDNRRLGIGACDPESLTPVSISGRSNGNLLSRAAPTGSGRTG